MAKPTPCEKPLVFRIRLQGVQRVRRRARRVGADGARRAAADAGEVAGKICRAGVDSKKNRD